MMKTSFLATALLSAGPAAAFWRMPCRSYTGVARMDPIVGPGKINGHSHIVFGSGGFALDASYDSLSSSSCTSCEVTQDKSAYWTPPLYFQYDNGTAVMVPNVGGMLAYYLPYLSNITAFPEGFRMLAGDPFIRNFTGPFPDTQLSSWPTDPTDQFFLQQRALGFNCLNYAKDPEPSLYRHQFPSKDYMDANCKDGLRLEMAFPSCGNGQNDSPDHKSHVAYPSLVKEGNCPEGYDVHLPFLFFETIWATNVFAGESGQFVLSPGDPVGTGYHGDFFMGWESSAFLQNAIDTCTNQSGEIQDCPLFNIQSDSTGAECKFDVPAELKNDDAIGPRSGLPVNVPIQYGPEQATPYPVAGASNVPTTSLAPTSAPSTFSNRPTLSYTAADPSVTSTALGGIIVAANSGGGPLLGVPLPTPNGAPIAPAAVAIPSSSSSSTFISMVSPAAVIPAQKQQQQQQQQQQQAGDIIATSYITSGNQVIELFIAETTVFITATATGSPPADQAQAHKRHLHQHLHNRDSF